MRFKVLEYRKACTLKDCPPGLLLFRGMFVYKSEYFSDGKVDAYCVDSGEYFWGGAITSKERDALIVTPILLQAKVSIFERVLRKVFSQENCV
jgi:hypothetical protein